MKARHQVSRNAVELIKRFEGYRESAARLANGRWTIGYGHTLTAREGARVSQPDAEALLMYDLIGVAHAVNEQTYAPLNQNQFDALVSFAFNIGIENFQRSAVLRRINEGALIQAACSMEMWRKADFGGERIVIDALVRRRSAEKHLFLTPPAGWVPAPSPILPPKIDYDASYAVPRQAPAPVVAPLDGERAEAHLDGSVVAVPVPPEEELEPSASELAAAAVSARLQALVPDEAQPSSPPAAAPATLTPDTTAFDVPPMPEPPAAEPAEPEPEAPPPAALNAAWPAPYIAPTLEEQEALSEQANAPDAEADAEPALIPDLPQTLAAAPVAEPPAAPQEPEAQEPSLFDSPPAPLAGEAAPPPWTLGEDDRNIVTSLDPAFPLDAKPGSTRAAPLLMLAVVSLVLFAGGVFGGLNAAADNSGSLMTAKAISWALCVAGAVGFVASAYLLLRLIDNSED